MKQQLKKKKPPKTLSVTTKDCLDSRMDSGHCFQNRHSPHKWKVSVRSHSSWHSILMTPHKNELPKQRAYKSSVLFNVSAQEMSWYRKSIVCCACTGSVGKALIESSMSLFVIAVQNQSTKYKHEQQLQNQSLSKYKEQQLTYVKLHFKSLKLQIIHKSLHAILSEYISAHLKETNNIYFLKLLILMATLAAQDVSIKTR